MQGATAHDVAGERVDQRFEQRCRASYPVGHGGAREVDAFAGIDLRLPVKRQVIGILGDEHVGEEPGAGPAALDRHAGQRRLDDAVAGSAAELGADVPDDPERGGHIVQLLGDILADPAHRTAAIRADAGGLVHDLVPRQVVGQRLAEGPGGLRPYRRDGRGSGLRLDLLQRELQLLYLACDLLRRAAELHPAQPRQLEPEPLGEQLVGVALGVDLDQQRLQEGGIVGQRCDVERHGRA